MKTKDQQHYREGRSKRGDASESCIFSLFPMSVCHRDIKIGDMDQRGVYRIEFTGGPDYMRVRLGFGRVVLLLSTGGMGRAVVGVLLTGRNRTGRDRTGFQADGLGLVVIELHTHLHSA